MEELRRDERGEEMDGDLLLDGELLVEEDI